MASAPSTDLPPREDALLLPGWMAALTSSLPVSLNPAGPNGWMLIAVYSAVCFWLIQRASRLLCPLLFPQTYGIPSKFLELERQKATAAASQAGAAAGGSSSSSSERAASGATSTSNRTTKGVPGFPLFREQEALAWDSRVVSQVHAVVICGLVAQQLWAGELDIALSGEHLDSADTPIRNIVAISAGYFLWDVVLCFGNFDSFGAEFFAHALLCVLLYGASVGTPCAVRFGARFLLFEASTIPLNFGWWMNRFQMPKASQAMLVVFAATFLVVRIFLGLPWGLSFYEQIYLHWDTTTQLVAGSLGLGNMALNCLNVFWGYKLVLKVVRGFTGSSTSKKAAGTAADAHTS